MPDFAKAQTKDAVGPAAGDIDTVAVVCLALVQKWEYDEMKASIKPAQVLGADGTALQIMPRLIVGPSKEVLEQVTLNFQKMWATYNERLETALRGKNHE